MRRVVDEIIKNLEPNEIFVFGSNESGLHGAGAAKMAYQKFGAEMGKGFGLVGQSYAIPTKDFRIETLPLKKIKMYIDFFLKDVIKNPDKIFLVTEVGCGLAGYDPKHIAPMFKEFLNIENVILPKSFIEVLEAQNV